MSDTLGRRIAALRNERSLTQYALAAEADVSVTFLSELENDHRGVGVDTLNAIATVLGASLDYLVRGTERAPAVALPISSALTELALRVRVLECGHPIERVTGKPITQTNLDALYDMIDQMACRHGRQAEGSTAGTTEAVDVGSDSH